MGNVPQDSSAKRAALYVRVSTTKQVEEGLSLDEQLRSSREAIESAEHWTGAADREYVERGVSGKRDSRPQLDRMLTDAEAGRFDVLVIVKLNRLGRSIRQLSKNFERLDGAGVELVSLRESIDTTTPTGRLLRNILGVIAEFENDARGESVSEVARPRAEKGMSWGGRFPPFGYIRREKRLVLDPRQADVVRRMFGEAAAGTSQHEITKRLNADGILTANGKPWTQGSVGRVLRRPLYYGAVSYKGKVVCESGDHKAIVSRGVWDAVQESFAKRNNNPGAVRGRPPTGGHLLTRGLLRCRCGWSMSPRTYKGEGREVYECRGRRDNGPEFCSQTPIPREQIDAPALDYFLSVGFDLEATRSAWEESVEQRTRRLGDAKQEADRDEAKAEEALSRIRGDYKAGKITADEWRGLRQELESDLDAARGNVARLRAQERRLADDAEIRDAESEVLRTLAALRNAAAGLIRDADGIEETRAAVRRVFARFEIHEAPGDPSRFVLHPELNAEMVESWGYRELEFVHDENGAVVLGEDGHPLPDPSSSKVIPPVFKKVPLDISTPIKEMSDTG